ncbi:SigE family RNA polymerase sigma factor [Kribbella sp. NPDC051587]|uniref:SigE family RNA polymerase sigma factor n=1 Tax=Kribbella sp. NPDC051587 TaxID=3364119 RepID=UPI0037B475EA
MRARDDAEFTEFAATMIRPLRRTAFLMCGDWHRAEDAAQDALVKVYRRWNRIERREGVRSYAHRAVVTSVLDQSRKPWRRERLNDPDDAALVVPDVGGPVDNRLMVVKALAQLPPSQRACVVLRYYNDLSVDETADVLGISAGGVKSQTSRGLDRLRQLIGHPERSAS